jgi:hypothetical protein
MKRRHVNIINLLNLTMVWQNFTKKRKINIFITDSEISERVKRNVETIIIETVVILDADYISYLKAKGHNTNESLYELVALKWMGVRKFC